nr:immunoglobulin heavy chain junction region [Macaca mulatta]
CATQDSNYDSW